MRILLSALTVSLTLFAGGAHAANAACEAQAAEKKLAGAAKTSFLTKCERDATATCEADSKQRNLAGAAKASHMKKCVADAVGS